PSFECQTAHTSTRGMLRYLRHLIPGTTIQLSSGVLLADAEHPVVRAVSDRNINVQVSIVIVRRMNPVLAPLFEEEGNACRLALVANGPHPLRRHRPGVLSALSPYDHPIDPTGRTAVAVWSRTIPPSTFVH